MDKESQFTKLEFHGQRPWKPWKLVRKPCIIIEESLAAEYCTNVRANSWERHSYWNTHIFGSFLPPGVHPGSPRRPEKNVISIRRGKKTS